MSRVCSEVREGESNVCLPLSPPVSLLSTTHPLLVAPVVLPLLPLLHVLPLARPTPPVHPVPVASPAASRLEPVLLEPPLPERLGLHGTVVHQVEALLLSVCEGVRERVREREGGCEQHAQPTTTAQMQAQQTHTLPNKQHHNTPTSSLAKKLNTAGTWPCW